MSTQTKRDPWPTIGLVVSVIFLVVAGILFSDRNDENNIVATIIGGIGVLLLIFSSSMSSPATGWTDDRRACLAAAVLVAADDHDPSWYQMRAESGFDAYLQERYSGSEVSPGPYCTVFGEPDDDLGEHAARCEAMVAGEVVQAESFLSSDDEYVAWEAADRRALADDGFVVWVSENFGEPEPPTESWGWGTYCTVGIDDNLRRSSVRSTAVDGVSIIAERQLLRPRWRLQR